MSSDTADQAFGVVAGALLVMLGMYLYVIWLENR